MIDRLQNERDKLFWELEAAKKRIKELEAKFDLEHEAYMDLFHQLSEYERKELETRNAPDTGK
jgi:hypothetical protein